MNSGQEDARAGSGIWYGHDDDRNTSLRVPKEFAQTNQAGELLAVWHAVKSAPIASSLHIISDSLYVINGLTTNLEK